MRQGDPSPAFVQVRLLDVPFGADRSYTYRLPERLIGQVRRGTLLVVPFGVGNKQVSALATDFADACDLPNVKSVSSVLDYPIDLPEELLELCLFMKERFLCSFGQALRAILPPGLNLHTETFYVLTEKTPKKPLREDLETLYRAVSAEGEAAEDELLSVFGEDAPDGLRSLCRAGYIARRSRVRRQFNEKTQQILRPNVPPEQLLALLSEDGGLTDKQRVVLEVLSHYPFATQRELSLYSGVSASVASALVKRGVLKREEVRVERDYLSTLDPIPQAAQTSLSEEQAEAVGTLTTLADRPEPQAALLYGVTGSGKTRVIVETVRHVLAKGQSAILLLPEIALTAQAANTYRAAFGEQLALIHSMLSAGERLDAFRAMREGRIRVVLGTRSAVFSPVRDLGVIVIDEEQESTYKSETSPRYHARDVARFRCARNNALLLLASATPSVESRFKAETGAYTLVKLTKRYGDAPLPQVRIEDLRGDENAFPDKLLGKALCETLEKTVSDGRQAILFANRRGYRSHVSCAKCGAVFACPQCTVSLTYHAYDGARKGAGRLNCHYCGYTRPLPKVCDVCGSEHIGYFGFGTQKLQEELEERFPTVRALRLDADTTGEKSAHRRILSAFENREAEVLFGTQMVAKGLDFPGVDLVGVISVDSTLYQNDFRAGERTFSLVTQLVGRAGRKSGQGLAILQTYNPDNEVLQLAATQDYEAFYRSEIRLRKSVQFPPFCSMLVFGVSAPEEAVCSAFAEEFASLLKAAHEREPDVKLRLFGPYPSGIYRVGGRFRQRLILKYSDSAKAREFFADVYAQGLAKCPRSARLEADVNPAVV